MSLKKILKIGGGFILAFILLIVVIGIMVPDPEQGTATGEATGETSAALNNTPVYQDKEWMQSSLDNSDMFLLFALEITDILSGKQEMNQQRLLFCAGEVSGWARNAQQASNDMKVSSDLEYAHDEYAKATGGFAAMGDYVNDGVLAVQRGNLEDGEKFLKTGVEKGNLAIVHYTNYMEVIKSHGVTPTPQ